ncbi:metal ABC transporter ATP-binding protein [Kallipyga gabonensis]|uniref:metal ABC transporter ATP-binding protein n=1 Tax=Kallipyga gabonensis TaxID=1686287 RepID=UPI0006B695FA|nr:ATP-binding cassette domain-containing protein [Kallipyga gabonensis]
MTKQAIYQIQDLSFSFESTPVLCGINVQIDQGDYVGIVGENGGGKSTFLRILTGELRPDHGQVLVFGKNIFSKEVRQKIGYVPQVDPLNQSAFPISCEEMVGLGLSGEIFPRFFHTQEEKEKIIYSLHHLGMGDYAGKNFHDLSGGQKQRVLIAKALVKEPEVLLLDEPTVGVDETHKKVLFDILDHMNRVHDMTIIMVTHETALGGAHWGKSYEISNHRLERRC